MKYQSIALSALLMCASPLLIAQAPTTLEASDQSVGISAQGHFFRQAEFNQVMAMLAKHPQKYWRIRTLSSRLPKRLGETKVKHYMGIASTNGLVKYDTRSSTYRLTDKGVSYHLSQVVTAD